MECKESRVYVRILLLMIFSLSVLSWINTQNFAAALDLSEKKYIDFLKKVDWSAIENHIQYFSSLGSRVTGYQGNYLAAEYIQMKFNEYGLETNVHTFNVTVPIDLGATISLSNYPQLQLTIYPLEPNLIIPTTVSNLTAPLVYVGQGGFEDMEGKTIEGSIVVMDFNSHGNLPDRFGAKAVIYIEPEWTTRQDLLQIRQRLPIYFPRFYMSREDFEKLDKATNLTGGSNGAVLASITSKMEWQVKVGKNIIGKINGSKYPNKYMIVCAHYDSYSIVPSVAPGANDAAGVATLLEIARIMALQEYKPEYSVLFVAFSGHYQGLVGSRYFVEDLIWKWWKTPDNKFDYNVEKTRLALWPETVIDLKLTSRSDTWALTDVGDFFGQTSRGVPQASASSYLYSYIQNEIVKLISARLGKSYTVIDAQHTSGIGGTALEFLASTRKARDAFPWGFIPLEHESFAYGCLATSVSLVTVDPMQSMPNPIDTIETVNFVNLRTQLETIIPVVYDLVMMPNNFVDYLKENGWYVSQEVQMVRRSEAFLSGTVAVYDKKSAWYSPIPNALVCLLRVRMGGEQRVWETMDKIVVMTDENGRFLIPHLQQTDIHQSDRYWIYAFKLNPETGMIEYGPDMGMYRYISTYPYASKLQTLYDEIGFVTVFKCGTVVLYDIIDPSTASTAGIIREISVLEAVGDTQPESYGVMIYPSEDKIVAFVPTDERIKIILRESHLGRIPLGTLLNSSEEKPFGEGYEFRAGEQYSFFNTPFQIAKSLLCLASYYASEVEKLGVSIPGMSIEDVRQSIQKVESELVAKRYHNAYYEAIKAWRLASNLYENVRNIKTDIIGTVPFFSLILILFSILFQQLVLPIRGGKRILSLIVIFTSFLGVLYLLHPGFRLASNPLMTIIGFIILIMIIPAVGIVGFSLNSAIKRMTEKMKGLHIIEIGRTSVIGLSFSMGIENLRKRKLRTVLAMLTIILVVTSLVMFTSVSKITRTLYAEMPIKPPYNGVLIRQKEWVYPLDKEYVDALMMMAKEKGKIVSPRSVLYTVEPSISSEMGRISYLLQRGDNAVGVYAALGLVPEAKVCYPGLEASIIKGTWLMEGMRWSCIISDYTAERLGITDVPDKIVFLGKTFIVVGIVNSTIFDRIWDLNLQPLTPFDHRIPEQDFMHASTNEILIVDYETLLSFNPEISAVSILCSEPEEALQLAEDIYATFNHLEVWAGLLNNVADSPIEKTILVSSGVTITLHGFQMQLIPMGISFMLILNILLGSIYERKRDINTLSTVGASPSHVAITFLAEAAVYSILSGMFGYLIAIFSMKFFLVGSGLPLNYSSSWVAISIALAFAVVFSSILYPLRIASRVVTPSFERRWKVTAKPIGDEWSVPLPFFFMDEEIKGVCSYLLEFLEGHLGVEAAGFSVIDMIFSESENLDMKIKSITFASRLAPYQLGVIQNVNILFTSSGSKRWDSVINLTRKAGPRDIWIKNNPAFIDVIRKQLLLWRALKPDERQKYIEYYQEYTRKWMNR